MMFSWTGCQVFLLLLSLHLACSAGDADIERRQRSNKDDLLNELEALIKKHRQNPTSGGIDLKKLKLLKEKMAEATDLMDQVFGATNSTSNPSPGGQSKVYTDCAEAYKSGQTKSGVYKIQVTQAADTPVYCDMDTAGGGWTVFQRRLNGSIDFYRGWDDYKLGFGAPAGEYWLGLDAIHQLTVDGNMELYIMLEEFHGTKSYAGYKTFTVGTASTNFKLSVNNYSGTIGDGLQYHNNMAFSTKDRDNDTYRNKSCAQERGGGWWYQSCMMSNLNGKYRSSAKASYSYGFSWYKLKSTYKYFLKGSAMMIRPKNFI